MNTSTVDIREYLLDNNPGKNSKVQSALDAFEFQCDVLRCAAELTAFSICTLFAYIKKYVVVDI